MIDLHAHTAKSDGTDTPTELVAAAAATGVTVLAITDHDTTAGWDEAATAAAAAGVALVRGAELSTRHRGISVHLLAYLFDDQNQSLRAEMDRARTDRLPRLKRIVARMAEDGFDVDWADVEAQIAPGAAAGRPHIADALVAKGHAAHRNDVFEQWLHNGSRYYVPHYAPDTADAIGLVRAAGGVPVIAHPFASTRGRVITDSDVRELAEAGLLGIEVDHRDHDETGKERAAALAEALQLIPTGSSDYHGEGKLNRLAEHTTSPASLAAIEQAATGVPVLR